MGWLSPMHWIFIMVIAVLLFGNRLPEIARSLGRSVNEFKRGLREVKENFDDELNSDPPPPRERLQPPTQNAQARQAKTEETEPEPTPTETHKE
jgi:sec-independent protein translocase protein TatA